MVSAPAPASPPRTPRFVQLHHEDQAAVRDELLRGLMAPAAFTAPKYLYDALGSRLFDAITELPEYYPTRTEAGIFAAHAAEMARCVPAGATLVDLGAGNCQKAARLFEVFKPKRYVAVDISVDYLRDALAALQRQHPALEVVGVGMDFSQSLALPPEALSAGDGGDPAPLLVFYPGSSIGNFTPDEALRFLRDVHGACARGGPGGGLLIGVDRVKAASVLESAYDDALGVTAAFNRNLLPRINRLAGADFALADWRHVALYNAAESRIEMHLEALRSVTVRWPGGERHFVRGERIHTENSYKWREPEFEALLRAAGFQGTQVWTDAKDWFSVFWAQA
jgi:dimethylhistidine N-methyltransferase